MAKQTSLYPNNYDDFFRNLKERIRSTQVKAALAVKRELVLLYWRIGRDIVPATILLGTSQEHGLSSWFF